MKSDDIHAGRAIPGYSGGSPLKQTPWSNCPATSQTSFVVVQDFYGRIYDFILPQGDFCVFFSCGRVNSSFYSWSSAPRLTFVCLVAEYKFCTTIMFVCLVAEEMVHVLFAGVTFGGRNDVVTLHRRAIGLGDVSTGSWHNRCFVGGEVQQNTIACAKEGRCATFCDDMILPGNIFWDKNWLFCFNLFYI